MMDAWKSGRARWPSRAAGGARVARSSELGRRPLAVTLMDTPLVVFRGAGSAPAVLVDRCAHRNYPLSLGRVKDDGVLECG